MTLEKYICFTFLDVLDLSKPTTTTYDLSNIKYNMILTASVNTIVKDDSVVALESMQSVTKNTYNTYNEVVPHNKLI